MAARWGRRQIAVSAEFEASLLEKLTHGLAPGGVGRSGLPDVADRRSGAVHDSLRTVPRQFFPERPARFPAMRPNTEPAISPDPPG
jgi:hypothetical protein